MIYLEDILELCAEAEVQEDSPRSLRIFEEVKKEKGEDLCVFDCFIVIDRLAKEISKTEPLSNLSANVNALVERIQKEYNIAVKASMTPLQICAADCLTRLI